MDHGAPLIETIAIGLVAAFIGGLVATRLRLPTIVGYLLAGVAVGPFTPGLVADTDTAQQLAELGVILLMFGVGIHFSIPQLLAVPLTVGLVAIMEAFPASRDIAALLRNKVEPRPGTETDADPFTAPVGD